MKIWKVILATLVIFSAGVLAGARLVEMRHAHFPRQPGQSVQPDGKCCGKTGRPDSTVAYPAPHGTNRDTRLAIPLGIRLPGRNVNKEFLERLDQDLNLAPDQRKQIEKILEESQKQNREIWKQIEPAIREEMKKSREEIRLALTPEQAARFEELMKRPKRSSRKASRPTISATCP